MKTRFSSIVTLKKNTLDKSERELQKVNKNLLYAQEQLQKSYEELENIEEPKKGTLSNYLASRTLLASQREVISHNINWVNFCQDQLRNAQEQFKLDMIEHEKYKYLELQEQKKRIQELQLQEAKELDEIASITFNKKSIKGKV